MFVFATVAVAIALYWPGAAALAELWTDARGDTYTHGFLIAALSVWLLWRRRAELTPESLPQPYRSMGLLALAGGVLIWAFGLRAGIQLVYLGGLPFLWWACVLLACGWRAARAALFPIAFIGFALPVWDYAIPVLQWLTVHVVRLALRITGVPSFFHGELVQIPAGVFEIQGGCSGLHYVVVGVSVAVLLGELRHDEWRTRLRWIVVAGALSVVSNWLRVYTIILAGHLTHMQSYLVRVSHYSYGWFVFMAALLAFFLYVRFRAPPPRAPRGALRQDFGSAPTTLGWLALVAAVAAIPAAWELVIAARLPADPDTLLSAARPELKDGWRASVSNSDWQPVQNETDAVRRWRFSRGDEVIEFYAAGYLEQRLRKKLGGRANVPGGIDTEVVDETRIEAGHRPFVEQELDRNGTRARLWRAYQVGDRWFTSAARAQFWYAARTMLTLRSPPSRVWMLRAACALDCIGAGQTLGRFVDKNGEVLWPD